MRFGKWLDTLLNHTNQFHKNIGSSEWEFLCLDPTIFNRWFSSVRIVLLPMRSTRPVSRSCFTLRSIVLFATFSLSTISAIVILGLSMSNSRILPVIPTSKPTSCRFGDYGCLAIISAVWYTERAFSLWDWSHDCRAWVKGRAARGVWKRRPKGTLEKSYESLWQRRLGE